MRAREFIVEFAPVGGDDREPDEEEILRQLAAQWFHGDEDPRAEKTLAAMGWEIGYNESGEDDAGVFLVRPGDENGDSYIAFNESDLELNEGFMSSPRVAANKPEIVSVQDDGKTITIKVRGHDGQVRALSNSNPAVLQQQLNLKYGLRLPHSIARRFVGMPASMAEGEMAVINRDIETSKMSAQDAKAGGVAEGVNDLGYEAQSLIKKLRRDVEEKRLQPTPQAVLAAARELAGDMDFAPQLLVQQVLGKGVAEEQLAEKSVSKAQFRTMAAAAHNPKFAKKVGISQDVAREFHSADKGANYKKLPKKATEGEVDEVIGFVTTNKPSKVTKPQTSLSTMRKEFEKDKPGQLEKLVRGEENPKGDKYVRTTTDEDSFWGMMPESKGQKK
jgi:hypothetical protein